MIRITNSLSLLMILASCTSLPRTGIGLVRPLEVKLVQIDFDQFRRADSSRAASNSPYAPTTRIEFAVPTNDSTTVMVFDSKGTLVSNVLSQVLDAGAYRLDFDLTELPTGVYLASYKVGHKTSTKKFLIMR